MTKKLRGKKLNLAKPSNKYAKVPMQVISNPKLTPVDKLIITYLYGQSDSGNYILAYTRIAKEISVSKRHLINRWKWLLANGYIREDDTDYYVMIGSPEELNNSNRSETGSPEQDKIKSEITSPDNHDAQMRLSHPNDEINSPTESELISPAKVNSQHLDGEPTAPNEHNKEERRKIENKIEQEISDLSSGLDKLQNLTTEIKLPGNDLSLILDKVSFFKRIYNLNSWGEIDLSNHNNAFIAFNVCKYFQMKDIEQGKAINMDKSLTLQINLVRYSKDLNSNLWKDFIHECRQADREDLIVAIRPNS